ncbi:glycosyl hydrolase family 62-domain-containing protein [Dichotomopilus funicola]|uniref:Alpha-L-arabinofuranosidase n=1 Tax=Dichotomopilus funicola TaxID=1934379 RepID=A0AAN6UYR4_9PEZI|nr:glycosyl hydrolase family 62-domain-containing protein [Dichotomopilus funicola]
MRCLSVMVAALWAGAVSAMPASESSTSSLTSRKPGKPGKPVTLPEEFEWKSTGPLIGPKDDDRQLAGIKDPTIIEKDGTYHVFASTAKAEGYNLVYLNFTSFDKADSAPFYYLDQAPLGVGYRAAPEVFYFAPHKLWYLIYQNDNAAYSTNPDISNPAGWTAPKTFYSVRPKTVDDNIGEGYWVDMWVICDAKNCHLFSSDDNGHLYRSQTKVSEFPEGMSEPVIALEDPDRYKLFEASCVYTVKGAVGKQKYLLLVEAIGTDSQRYFRSWTSDKIDGEWTPLADTEENPFARANNVEFEGDAWTKSISHGEVVRKLTDQTLTIDVSQPLQFLYQGLDPSKDSGEYNALPWRLALITQEKTSSCKPRE